jgi:hypothetical protein
MKALALKNSSLLFAAVLASLVGLALPQKSFATDTLVTCNSPQVQLSAGKDGTKPRVTIYCSGGSSEGGIVYFASEISANSNVADLIPTLVANFVLINGTSAPITLWSNLSDTSGAAWGCGGSNCRILDQMLGY